MNTLFKIYLLIFLCIIPLKNFGQGSFGNLNFELANVPVIPSGQLGGFVPTDQAIPSWNAYYGTAQISEITHNSVSLGGAFISILGPQWDSSQILAGNYTLRLNGSFGGAPPSSVAIGQTGLIPVGIQSLQFFSNPNSSLQVTFNDQLIPLVRLNSFGDSIILLGGDFSTYAGQTGELRFTASPNTGGLLDSIIFSTSPVPEPNTFALTGIGALLFGIFYRRNSQRK